jgi:hypothetical protein
MRDDRQSTAGLLLILAAVVLAALMVFIWTGGNLGGTKSVESDADLPKVTSPAPPSGTDRADNTGRR